MIRLSLLLSTLCTNLLSSHEKVVSSPSRNKGVLNNRVVWSITRYISFRCTISGSRRLRFSRGSTISGSRLTSFSRKIRPVYLEVLQNTSKRCCHITLIMFPEFCIVNALKPQKVIRAEGAFLAVYSRRGEGRVVRFPDPPESHSNSQVSF